MPIALGIGAAIMIALALSAKSSPHPRTVSTAPRVTPPVPPVAIPQHSVVPERQAAESVQRGEGSAEDFESLANSADRQGDTQTAQTLRERAASAPERSTIEQVQPAQPTPEPAPVVVQPTPASAPVVQPTPAPAPVVQPTPAPAPVVQSPLPAGFKPGEAARLAPALARNIRAKRYNYHRRGLTVFQRAAGLAPDGIYGGKSAGALKFYGVRNPPHPLFKVNGSLAVISYPAVLANAARAIRAT